MRTRDTTAHRTALAGTLALAAAPFLLPAAARAATSAQEACPAKPGPHNLGQLAASFNDQGDQDPSNDTIEATLTLCGKAGAKSAYELSLDAAGALFSDADRNLDGTVDRRDFCVQTRDAVAGLDAGNGTGVGTATLMPGAGGAPDQVRFSVPVDAIASGLARNGQTQVYLWAETRRVAAIPVQPFTFMANRNVVDRLPVPNVTDGCALPQAAGEVLAVTLAAPPQVQCPASCVSAINQYGNTVDPFDRVNNFQCGNVASPAGFVSFNIGDNVLTIGGLCYISFSTDIGSATEDLPLSPQETAACVPLALTVIKKLAGLTCPP